MALDMNRERAGGMAAILARMLTTLEQKVNPAHAALLVVDVQNDFCAPGGYLNQEYGDISLVQAMVPSLVKFIDKARQFGVPIIYVQSEYNTQNTWYLSDVWLEHVYRKRPAGGYIKYAVCEPNSWGADFYTGINPLTSEIIVKKHRYSAFANTDLDMILRSKKIRTLIMTGVASGGCVEATSMAGFLNDYYIVLMRDCSAARSQQIHSTALEKADLTFGVVADADEVIKCWENIKAAQR